VLYIVSPTLGIMLSALGVGGGSQAGGEQQPTLQRHGCSSESAAGDLVPVHRMLYL